MSAGRPGRDGRDAPNDRHAPLARQNAIERLLDAIEIGAEPLVVRKRRPRELDDHE